LIFSREAAELLSVI